MNPTAANWERTWAPYDAPTYRQVLAALRPGDTVLEIGAGDLRLAVQMAAQVRWVYAVEIDPVVLACGVRRYTPLPGNLTVLCGDARLIEIPRGVTIGVLLMRHCTHYALYARRLRLAGCRRLITNARWHMDVENVDLVRRLAAYDQTPMGWYACDCGAVGFKPGPVESWTAEHDARTHAVRACPTCTSNKLDGVDE